MESQERMSGNDIIKALEHCVRIEWIDECEGCPLSENAKCITVAMRNALDLIKRRESVIEVLREDNHMISNGYESLKAENEALKLINSTYEVETKRVRDIAIQEVAEKIKNIDLYRCVEEHYKNAKPYYEVRRDLFCGYIDNLVKKMTEEQE